MFCQNSGNLRMLHRVRILCGGLFWFLWLLFIRCLTVHAEPYVREIRQEVTYEAEGVDEILPKIEVQVRDGDQETLVFCELEELNEADNHWEDGFELPVTFHVYDADEFILGEYRIPARSTLKPVMNAEELVRCEAEILSLAGLTPDRYRIQDMHWDGEVYQDGNGDLCRNAVAVGQKLVTTYNVVYKGTAEFAEKPDYLRTTREVITEEEIVPASPETGTEAETEVSGTTEAKVWIPEEEAREEELQQEFWKRIIRILTYTIGFGILLMLSALLFWSLRYAEERRRQRKTERQKKS